MVQPLGGKTSSFLGSIIADRTIKPNLAAIVDHDFDCRDFAPTNSPIPCVYQQVQVGWAWERKEIENYLLDPEFVRRALGRKAPPFEEYQSALNKAAKKIATYTAARTALACYQFKNFWGYPVKDNYFSSSYCFPSALDQAVCRVKIEETVRQFAGNRIVTHENVLEKFERLLPSFLPGGFRFEHCLTFFAGKDLLWAMKDELVEFGFDFDNPIQQFLERLVKRMEHSQEDVWTWLSEWQTLRDLIVKTSFSAPSRT